MNMVFSICLQVLRAPSFWTKVSPTLNIQFNLPCFYHSFKYSDLEIRLKSSSDQKKKPDIKPVSFGKHFSEHMLEIEWNEDKGWSKPLISPLHDFVIHPASKVFHYALEVHYGHSSMVQNRNLWKRDGSSFHLRIRKENGLFDGLKAYKNDEGKVLLFRPELNVQRMLMSAERLSLPTFDGPEFLKCLKRLISIDKDWVPQDQNCSLYVRPTFIGTEPSLGIGASKRALLYVITGPVGAYFPTGAVKPISLLADPKYVRSWPGGAGNYKLGCNYAPTVYIQKIAESQNHQQVLWLFNEDHRLIEVGTMNIFIYMRNSESELELITPPLDGLVLPGVTRRSLLDLARKWNKFKVSERPITMKEIIKAKNEMRLLEIFGAGTACVVCPVGSITYLNETIKIDTDKSPDLLYMQFLTALKNIQYGKLHSEWSVPVD